MILRSVGWTVRPTFVPYGVTTPVTLLADDQGLTQLTGDPEVAWQTPWSELGNVNLVRFRRGTAIFATAAGVRYCWRHPDLTDYDAWREMVLAHGGSVARRQRRLGVVAVVAVVLLASLAGGIVASFSNSSVPSSEVAAVKAVNLRLDDLPAGWTTTPNSYLLAVVPQPGKVFKVSTTPTTQPSPTSKWGEITALFQGCLGVSNRRDRVFGQAGQQPNYQVTSPIFRGDSFGGVDLASTTQYYATTTMVHRDVAEMSESRFGSCFVAVNAAMMIAYVNGKVPQVAPGSTWNPITFVKGWARGGEVLVKIPGLSTPLHLVVAVIAAGHFEVTLCALVAQWPASQTFLTSMVNTLVSRVSSSSSTAA